MYINLQIIGFVYGYTVLGYVKKILKKIVILIYRLKVLFTATLFQTAFKNS